MDYMDYMDEHSKHVPCRTHFKGTYAVDVTILAGYSTATIRGRYVDRLFKA